MESPEVPQNEFWLIGLIVHLLFYVIAFKVGCTFLRYLYYTNKYDVTKFVKKEDNREIKDWERFQTIRQSLVTQDEDDLWPPSDTDFKQCGLDGLTGPKKRGRGVGVRYNLSGKPPAK